MDKLEIYKDSIEKLAINKARKMYNSGMLSIKSQDKLFKPIEVTNNINNKINARALRKSSGAWPKSPMTANRYKKLSKVDSLPERAPLDSRRFTKASGRNNSLVISELNKTWPEGLNVSYQDKGFGGSFKPKYNDKGIAGASVVLPNKNLVPADVKNPGRRDRAGKEMRAITARHEISGEATTLRRGEKLSQLRGRTPNPKNTMMFSHSTHLSPEVLIDDADLYKNFSPMAKILEQRNRQANLVNSKKGGLTKFHIGGKKMNEAEEINQVLGKPLKTPLTDSVNITDKQKEELNRAMLEKNLKDKKDKKHAKALANAFTNISFLDA